MSPMKMDKTNIAIIKHLRDGRKSFKQIADDLAVTENTVRSRVNQMIESGVMEISGLIDPEKIPEHNMVIVGIKLDTMDLVKKGEEFSKLCLSGKCEQSSFGNFARTADLLL